MRINELNIDIATLLNEFANEERELLEVDASEQAISNRLARKFELVSHGWNVDCEYNRDQGAIKTLKYALSENGGKTTGQPPHRKHPTTISWVLPMTAIV